MKTELPDLIGLRAPIRNGAAAGEKLPSRLKVLNWGENPSTKGTFVVGAKSLAVLGENQRALGFERVAIDYNHASLEGSPEYRKGEVPPFFGYGRPVVVANEGLFLEDVEWTPLGVEKARTLEDLSPVVAPKDGGEVTFVHSVALTPNGSLYDVQFLSATAEKDQKESMSDNNNKMTGITLVALAAAVGLGAEATEEQVMGKVKGLTALEPLGALLKDGKVVVLESLSAIDGRLKVIEDGLKAAKPADATALTALSARVTELESNLTQQLSVATETEKSNVIALMAKDGQAPVNPKSKAAYTNAELKALSLGELQMLQANSPRVVPLSAKAPKVTLDDKGQPAGDKKGMARMVSAMEREAQSRG